MSKYLTDEFEKSLKPLGLMFPKSKSPTKEEKREKQVKAWNEMKKRSVRKRAKFGIVRHKKTPKRKKQAKIAKLPKVKTLEAKLKKILYPLIKKRDGNTCISCGRKGLVAGRYGNWHPGHYLKAELCNIIYRYDERNINSQCLQCNVFLHGNTVEYRKAMLKKYGAKVVKELEDNYNKTLPMNVSEREILLKLINKYK